MADTPKLPRVPSEPESEEQKKVREQLEAYHKLVGPVPPEPTIGEILNLKAPQSNRPRESFTDGDRDFPLPHENRSWTTGEKRKVSAPLVPSETLPSVPGPPAPEQPRTQKVSRVMAGGLFAVFLGSIIQALQLYGLINAFAGHIFMLIALVAGILIITTEILPLKPTRHKATAIIVLFVLLGAIDFAASLYANKREAKRASSGASPASQPTPEKLQDNVFLAEKYPSLGNPKTFTFFGDKHYGSVSFQARFGLGTSFSIILLIHSTEPEPGIAVGDCLTAINNYQAIIDSLKVEAKKRSPEFIDFIVTPNLVCHYDYATDIPPEQVEALKRIASSKQLALSIEGARGPK